MSVKVLERSSVILMEEPTFLRILLEIKSVVLILNVVILSSSHVMFR